MTALILGGTGAMGIHLVKLLAQSGIDVTVTSRKKNQDAGNVSYLQGDAHDIDFIKIVSKKKWDVIIDFMVYSTSTFQERVELLLEIASQYVFLSSARVYADSEFPLTETSERLVDISHDREFLATDEYSLSKARQEDILQRLAKKNWTIIRPYITYSDSRLQLGVLEKEEWLYRALKGRSIVFSGDISSKMTTMTYGLDVAKGIQALIGNSQAFGETFHITTNYSHTWEEILTLYLKVIKKHIGREPKVLYKDLSVFLKVKSTRYQIIYDRFYNRRFDNSKIDKYIDTNQFHQTEEGLEICITEFLKSPKFKNVNWKSEALKDRLTKEHASLKEIQGVKQKIKYIVFRYFLPA